MIDPEVADREWSTNSDHAKAIGGNAMAASAGRPQTAPAEPPAPEVGGARRPTYADSRAVREAYAARLSKLEFEQKSGKLVESDAVEQKWMQIASTVRTKILGIPSKAKQRIPELDAVGYATLEAIVRESLEDLES